MLALAGETEGAGRDADALAFRRDVLDFTNCLIVEQPNGDFAQTIARQFLFSNYQELLFDALSASREPRFAAIAMKAAKEVTYHVKLANDWMVRLGDGTEESHARVTAGLEWMWRFVDEMFVMDEVEAALARDGVAVDKTALRSIWDAKAGAVLAEATLNASRAAAWDHGWPQRSPLRTSRPPLERDAVFAARLSGSDVVNPAHNRELTARVREILAQVPDPKFRRCR